MAKKAEEILKAQGLSDADITAMAPMLTDARYRAAIENSYNSVESERDQWKARNDDWEQLQEKNLATLKAAEEETIRARREAADKAELLRIAKDFGYLNDDDARKKQEEIDAQKRQGTQGGFDPNDPKFQDFSGRFAVGQGRAMAMYTDIANQHQRLFGEPLDGFEKLYDEFLALSPQQRQNTTMKDVWEKKFNVQAKRDEMTAKRQADHDAEVARKAVEDYAIKYGTNPNTQGSHTSRNSFSPIRQTADGKMPWEDSIERRQSRLQRAFETQTRASVN